jgi:CubicO group peptidase (beta-lactamase class C family)
LKKYISVIVFMTFAAWLAWPERSLADQPLSVKVSNGFIDVSDGQTLIAHVSPSVFTQGWAYHLFDQSGDDPLFDSFLTLPGGGKITLHTNAEILKSGIHVRFDMTPLSPVTVIDARATVTLTYGDWIGVSYQVSDSKGMVPNDLSSQIVLATGDKGIMTLGPNPGKGGLTLKVEAPQLRTTLQDDRKWGNTLSIILSQGPIAGQPFAWKAGEMKSFDFTLSFNHKTAAKTFPTRVQDKGLVGTWQAMSLPEDGKPEAKIPEGITVEKDKRGKYTVTHYSPIWGEEGTPSTVVKVQGRKLHVEMPGPSTLDLELDPTGTILQGQGTWHEYSFKSKFQRGFAFLAPRFTAEGRVQGEYTYQLPEKLGDGWETWDLRDARVDFKKIKRGIDSRILTGGYPNFQGLVVAQHGKLLMDEYFYGFGPQDLHQIQSDSKSVFSILFGIAGDHGLLNPQQKLYDFFPEYRGKPGWEPRKDRITLGTILSMTSGFACDDWIPETDCHQVMMRSPDWLDFVLSQPMNHEPEEHWAYCNDCLEPLGVILAKQSGLSDQDFAKKYLFGPLGITDFKWDKSDDPKGITDIAGSIWMRPRDMAKLGQLYLQKGMWNGKRVVSEKWVEESTRPQAPNPKENHRDFEYGYLWWMKQMPFKNGTIRVFYASGLGGQYIFVVPELELVCVLTGGNYTNDDYQEEGFFKSYILGAFE